VYLCVLCGSQKNQLLFPYIALTDWFLKPRFNHSKPSGHYMYNQFNIKNNPLSYQTVHLCVLCGSQNKQRLFSYTPLMTGFYNLDGVCLLRGTDSVFKYSTS